MMIIYNSEVTLRDGYIMNIGSGNGLAVLGTSDVLMDGMSFTTTAEDTSGVLVGEGSLTEFTDCMFLSGSILDITSEFVNGVYVADGGYATVDECLIIFDEGVGLLAGSGSEVDIYDTDILMEEAYGISANKNSSVFVSKGSYLARWALFSNGGDITIDTGIFESEYYGVPAISSNGSNFGTNITIQSGSLATPSNWRTTAQDAIAVYKNMNKPGNLKVNLSGSYNNIKATWNKVSGATGYAIYYKKGTGSYKFWGRTTKNTVTIKNLTAGAKYNVKVVPYKKCEGTYNTFYGEGNKYSTAYTYTLKKVTLSTFSKSGSKVKVKWKNISGETGYQISKSIKKTGTNIVSTYKTTTGTYKLVSATKGKTYYYKIRAYKTVNGSKIYGPWSNVKAYKR
ncbi:MAG: fibronectin type III domain-containing protein [Lachnospiraceae bacterium]|nr:fibronectin type III domain-containing protein [Lachnospiraceae bacterium]